ncbi:ornithine aminomutase subunit alpha [Fundicoccus culcitae]|uniref:Ornithine aminomutase subunit alpha n=1 Tax=Fundicoccus culcitae TaxID=2969821 RepID=A0ABY5P431_9LACT|nr:ornithine aminomutase subunit alpha [Fundicoccus culcitae]UUX33504.1 ornithine aminomutase subunit alpha [Fundicoccus culcitae]
MEETKNFEEARQPLAHLSDEALKDHFWELIDEIIAPLLKMGHEYTSPSIERSVIMRMGFSSTEATAIVDQVLKYDFMSKGAGHLVYRIAKENDLSIRQAGLELGEGKHWDQVEAIFRGGDVNDGI